MAEMDGYYRGNLAAYIELLSTGIRDMCLPDASARRKAHMNYVDKEARKNGLYTLLVTFKRTRPNGRSFRSYQRIMYCPGKRADAEQLRKRLQKSPKDKTDHKVMGKLLGYSPKAITSFINMISKAKKEQGGHNGKERNQRCKEHHSRV